MDCIIREATEIEFQFKIMNREDVLPKKVMDISHLFLGRWQEASLIEFSDGFSTGLCTLG
jgi:hypothetical protein